MNKLVNLTTSGDWNSQVGRINNNIQSIQDELENLGEGSSDFLGFFKSLPTGYHKEGEYLYLSDNTSAEFPAYKYVYTGGHWVKQTGTYYPGNPEIHTLLQSEDVTGNVESILLD